MFSFLGEVLLNVARDMECLPFPLTECPAFPDFLIHPPLPPCCCGKFSIPASPSPPSPASISSSFAFTVVVFVFCGVSSSAVVHKRSRPVSTVSAQTFRCKCGEKTNRRKPRQPPKARPEPKKSLTRIRLVQFLR